MRALQGRVDGIRNRRHGDGSGDGGIQVLRDLSRATDHDALDGPRARFALGRFASGLERFELGESRPFRVDREPAPVGKYQGELDRFAVHPEIGREHRRRQFGQPFAQHVLARPTLRRAAREHGREPPDHVSLFLVDLTALGLLEL